MDIIVTLGCDKTTTGHVDTKAGVLGVLEERFRGRLQLGVIIPAKAWTVNLLTKCGKEKILRSI